MPWAKAVTVDKNKAAYSSGENSQQYLAEGRERLRYNAAEAVRCASRMKPVLLKGPLHFEAVFRTEQLANKFNTWNFRRKGEIVAWEAADMREGFEMLNRLVFIPRMVYPFRRPLVFVVRNYFRIKNTYFAPSPDSEELTDDVDQRAKRR